MELYDYQSRAVEALRDNIRSGIKRQILCAPTGSGKTVIATHMIGEAARRGSRAIFVCDRIALIDQTSGTFDGEGIRHGVIQGDHWRYRPHHEIQVASAQTLARRGWPDGLDLIIVDEAHTMHDVVRERIMRDDVIAIGLTATPFAQGMGDVYQAIVSVTTTYDLIDQRRLAPFEVFAPSEPDMTGARTNSFGEWTHKDAAERSIKIIGDVVEQYTRHAYGRKFIAFGATIAHCEAMQRQFAASGIRTECFTARTSREERDLILGEYRKPDSSIAGLVSVAALAKGFDVPDVSCIIIARPLKKSLAEHIQIIGRGLRSDPANADKKCIILDHAGNWMRFAEDTEDFFQHSVHVLPDGEAKKPTTEQRDKEESWRKCPSCSHAHKAAPSCPRCGHEYPRKQITHEAGQLSRVGEISSDMWDERRRWFDQLEYIRAERGYKQGFTKIKYKEKFGSWPPRAWEAEPQAPSIEVANWVKGQMIRHAKRRRRA